VYALACVLFECLTGEPPFQANSIEQIMTSHLFMPPPQPSQANRTLSPVFDDVVARGMAKEPDDRYGSCGALGRATQRAVESDTTVRPLPAPTVQLPTQRAPVYPRTAGDFSDPTMQRPTTVAPRSYSPPPPSYTPPPTPSAPPPASSPTPAAASRKWLIPAVVAVVAVVALGGIGIVIGLLSNDDSKPVATEPVRPDPSVQQSDPDTDTKNPGPTSDPTPTVNPLSVGSPPPPPLVGPDSSANQTSCTGDYALPRRNDPGTHARRGSADTSCMFTESVLHSYWQKYGDASRDLRQVSAPGAVDCRSVGSGIPCDGPNFVMDCQARPGNAYITCTGGRDAVIYLY
jgi:serine/threonine-protein kinase